MANPLIEMLAANVTKFKATTNNINKKFNDLIDAEKEAFPLLKDYWKQNNFNSAHCEELLKKMALGKNKHPNDKELLEDLQEFRRLCKDYYTKDKAIYEAFQKALGGKGKPAPTPQPAPTPNHNQPMNPLLDMLEQNVRKWQEITEILYKKYDSLIPEEKEAFVQLDDYWNKYDFNATKCEELIELLAKGKKKHPTDYELLTSLQDYRRLCKDYYTKDKKYFQAFQKALGGKGSKKPRTIPKPDPKPQPKQQYQVPKPIFGKNRIDYPNGDYYIGEYKDELPNGKGKWYRNNGNWQEGNFTDGELHGKGAEYYAEHGRTDRGEYNHGDRTGKGIMLWKDGNRYEGEWNNDGANGKGQYSYANGNWRKGTFVDGELHGPGKFYNSEYKYTESGNYQYGELVGKSTTIWDSGLKFKGTMIDAANGKGILYYTDGTKEKGMYVNGSWVPVGGEGNGTRSKYTGGSWVGNIGRWIWGNLIFVPWIIVAIVIVSTWIESGFWSALLAGIIGAVIAGIATWLIAIGQAVLEGIYEFLAGLPKVIKIILWTGVIGSFVYFTFLEDFIGSFLNKSPAAVVVQTPKITGKWSGKLNNSIVVLEILNVDGDKVTADLHFPNDKTEKLAGTINGNTLYLKDQIVNGWYDGEYTGIITENESYTGKYSNPKTGSQLNFTFTKQ